MVSSRWIVSLFLLAYFLVRFQPLNHYFFSMNRELSIPLMIASEQFMLTRLKALCQDHIRTRITVDNVIGVFIASHQHNATGLKEIALEFIIKHLNDPAVITGLSELKSEPDLLVEIITRNSTNQLSSTPTASPSRLSGFGQHSEWSGSRR